MNSYTNQMCSGFERQVSVTDENPLGPSRLWRGLASAAVGHSV